MRNPILVLFSGLLLVACSGGDVKEIDDGVIVTLPQKSETAVKKVRLQVMNDKIIRVSATPGEEFSTSKSLVVLPQKNKISFETEKSGGVVTVKTKMLQASVDLNTGLVSFSDLNGKSILKEDEEGKTFEPINVEGINAYTVRDVFQTDESEGLYGLGQHQADEFNYKGKSEELFQYNTKVSVPFIVSTKNYGILWDAYSLLRFGDKREYMQLNRVFKLYDKDGKKGALTGTYEFKNEYGQASPLVRREDSLYFENLKTIKNLPQKISLSKTTVLYEGTLVPNESGTFRFLLYYAGYIKVFVNNKEVVAERWRTAWNPNSYKFAVDMKAGNRVPLRIEWVPDGDESYCGLRVLTPESDAERNKLAFWGEMQHELDYYFIAGKTMDEVIGGYRTLTGKSQIMPKWAMGYWQSRDRYETQAQLVNTFKSFRSRRIPIDNIVQDWSYWPVDAWGSHDFDKQRYPDSKAMVDAIHDMHGRVMISVWPKFYPSTDNYKELDAKGYIYQQAIKDSIRDWISPGYVGSFYDPYSQEARDIFWRQINDKLYSKGVDAWWMDASEPDIQANSDMDYRKKLCSPTAIGPSAMYFNTYALMNARAIYEGQRKADPNKRVFLLTRSGFAGLQRYSAATWSGDIASRWEDMKAQITAGMNYALSGIPYWTMDIGGYCTENRYVKAAKLYESMGVENKDMQEWRELNARWHQFAAFAPLYRSHGKYPLREVWHIAPSYHPAYQSILYYMNLRYEMMPYIYSLAGMTYFGDYTIMRALVMDFEQDKNVYNIDDQYMFGPSIMVCPVYTYLSRSRDVYFPAQAIWYDFYTGKSYDGEQRISVEAPYERIPLYVRAGSIIPYGSAMQYSDEKPAENVTLYVFKGTDGKFTLYEDEGTNYNYEKGAYTMIPMLYNEKTQTLTIEDRKGGFNGMLKDRTFNVIVVSGDHPQGFDPKAKGVEVKYSGKKVEVRI